MAAAHELPTAQLDEGDVPGGSLGRQLRAAGLHPPSLPREGLAGVERHVD